jgi:hypothetical protein
MKAQIKWFSKYADIIFFLLGIAGIIHHKFVSGNWFDWYALKHHEPIIIVCFSLALFALLFRSNQDD